MTTIVIAGELHHVSYNRNTLLMSILQVTVHGYYFTGLCATPQTPRNGNLVINGSEVGSIAQYSCLPRYTLVGPEQRECRADIGWSERDPSCRKLNLEINYVLYVSIAILRIR